MNLSELSRGVKPFVQRWIDGALRDGGRDIGTAGSPFDVVYADSIEASGVSIPEIYNDSLDPTGWLNNSNIIVTYDSAARTITLTTSSGNLEYYWRGVKTSLGASWVSSAHENTVGHTYFLYSVDGVNFAWYKGTPWTFDMLMIASVDFQAAYKWAAAETHGLMQWQVHEELHANIGTYKESGGQLQGYTGGSTTATNRRPTVTATLLHDEDIELSLAADTSLTYNKFYLSGTDAVNFTGKTAEILPVTGNQPFYNQWNGSAWVQTGMTINTYASVWLIATMVTADAASQAYRYFWVQPQSEGTLAQQQALTTANISLGVFNDEIAEFVVLAKVIIKYNNAGTGWEITSVTEISGSRFSLVGSAAGAFLASVSIDGSLSGNGTASSILSAATNTSTATAAGTTTLVYSSTDLQQFTGTTTQTVLLPVVTTLRVGRQFRIHNHSTGAVTVNSSGGNVVQVLSAGMAATFTCESVAADTSAAPWDVDFLVQASEYGSLSAIGALAVADGNVIVGNGSTWVAESGATARTSLGVGTGDSPQFAAVNLGHASDTTLTRVSAGLIAVEGDTVALLTATQTLTNKTLTTPTIASFANATHNHSNAAGGGTIAHSALTGIGANDHHNQSHVLATNAALGVDHTISGATAGHVLRASSATAAAFAAIADADLPSTIVRTSRALTAGAGLTGGGDLSADRAFAVGAGLGITVNADDVALTTPGSLSATSTNASTGSHTHAIDSTIARSAITITAGAGLTGGGDLSANRTLDVGVSGLGLSAGADAIALASSSNPGAAASILATDASGALTLVRATLSQATGTAPLTVSSTTVVSNLNADKADGFDFDQDVRTTGVPQFERIGAGVAAHATYKLYVLGDSLLDGHIETDSLDVNGAATVYGGDLKIFPVGDFTTPLLYVDESTRSIGVNRDPDPQFDVDVAGALRAAWLVGPHAIQLSDATAIMHFDGPGPYNTNYTGTSQTHKGDVATTSGHVIYRPGKFGKSVQVAEGTTNKVLNPSAEVDTGNVISQNITLTRVTTDALYGDACYKAVSTSADSWIMWYTDSVAASTVYTITAYVKTIAGASIGMSAYDGVAEMSGTRFGATVATGGWDYIGTTITTNVGATTLRPMLRTNFNGSDTYVDGVQCEQKAYATPYHDGSLTTPTSWDGTAHASTSTRTVGTITYSTANLIDSARGTISYWVYESVPGGSLFHFGASGSANQFLLFRDNINSGRYLYYVGGTGIAVQYANNYLGQWTHICATWDYAANELKIYVNGVLAGSNTYTVLANLGASFGVGYDPFYGSSYVLNGLIDDFAILSRAASADEIRAIYESNAPVFAESSTAFFKSYGPTPVEINDEGFWVEGPTVGAIFGIYGAASTKSWGGVTLSEGDVLIGRSPAYALWDDSEVKLKIGNVSAEHIAFDGTKIEFLNGASSMGSLTNTTWVIGPAAGDRLELTATDLRFKTGASQVDAIFDANSITLGSATTMQTVITNSSFLSGDAAGENVYITSAGLYLRNASTNYLTLAGSTATIGQIANSKSRVEIDDTNGIRLISRSAGGVDTTAVSLTHAGAASFAGYVTLGSKFQLTINSMLIGSNLATENVSLATIFENSTQIGATPGDEAFDAGDVLIGDWENANVLWDASAGQLKFRDATTVQAYVDTDGSIKAGAGAVTLDAGGITIASEYAAVSAPSVGGDPTAIVWKDGATEVAWLTVYTDPVLTLQSAGDLYISTQYDMYLSAFDGTVIVDSYMRANGPITFLEQTGAPTNPIDGTQTQTYMKGDKFVIQYNHGGTLKYRYLTLTSTDATWTYTTTAP